MILSSKSARTVSSPGLKTSFCTLLVSLLLATVPASGQPALTEEPLKADSLKTPSLKPYRAKYSARISGLNIDAIHKLEEIEPGIFRESLNAKNFIGSINEQTTFRLSADQGLLPGKYSYTRSIFGSDRSEVQDFNWQDSSVTYRKDGTTKAEIELQSGYLDMITHRLQLRRDLNAGKQTFSYPVISRGKLKQYDYRVTSQQVLDTAIGPLNTVKVERITDNSDKSISVWLATDWDYLIVKLQQTKGKDNHRLELRHAIIDNKKVTPLEKIDEKQL